MEPTSYIKDGFHLQRLQPGDWQLFKAISIASAQEPGNFSITPEGYAVHPDSYWQERLAHPRKVQFTLHHNQGACIGTTGIVPVDEDPNTARFVASFIQREHRGKNLSDLYYQARFDWARQVSYKRAIISHREGNIPSQKAIQKHGFTYTHTEPTTWPDGVTSGKIFYELTL